MTSLVTSSAGILNSRIGSHKRIFAPILETDLSFFDESERQVYIRAASEDSISGSIDTRTIDAYAQGVEITSQRRYDAGMVKIWSGEPGHQTRKSRFGMDSSRVFTTQFADSDYFKPVKFIEAQASASPLWSSVITLPIIIGDNLNENDDFNGVIEPLSIRKVVNFTSTDLPFESHAVRGLFGNGNCDIRGGSSQVVSMLEFNEFDKDSGFLDLVELIGDTPMNGFFSDALAHIAPFKDERLVRNMSASYYVPSDMVAALSLMTGSTNNYVQSGFKSAACGRDYDNTTVVGTDSIAFGGMTY